MKTLLRCFLPAALLTLLAGCSSHPVGISKADWQKLSPRQQAELHQRELQQYQQDARAMEAFSVALGSLREDR